MHAVVRRIAVASTAGVIAIVIALAIATSTSGAETGVGVDAGVSVAHNSLDVGFAQSLQSTLNSQFAGVRVAVVHGRLVLEGFATPGVHSAVLGIVANLLQKPVPVPAALGIVTPDLGLPLPLLGAGAVIEIPDLSGVIRMLGVVDHIQIIR